MEEAANLEAMETQNYFATAAEVCHPCLSYKILLADPLQLGGEEEY